LKFLIVIYLTLGTIYTIYIYSKAPRNILWVPINILFGPIMVVYIIILSKRGKRLPVDWW
ncbi:hypothetical protein KKG08_00495, partial [Patescibacteria group bacterium]|nr:hypothetical protein [Patescibacteria group bacterium]